MSGALLERCFDKDPKRRLRDIGDVITELEKHHPRRSPFDRPVLRGGCLPPQ